MTPDDQQRASAGAPNAPDALEVSGAAPDSTLLVNRHHMPFVLGDQVTTQAAIGLIVLSTDASIEQEWRQIFAAVGEARSGCKTTPLRPAAEEIGLFCARIQNADEINPETLQAMRARMGETTRLFLPNVPMDVIAYGCTSATMVIGEAEVAEEIHAVREGVKVTTPITAAQAALRRHGITRVALLTPYVDEINQRMRAYLEARGFVVPVMGSFNEPLDSVVCQIAPASVRDAAIELGKHPEVDGVFVSCTSLRIARVVEEIETATGKFATSSNHAMAWHALDLAGVLGPTPGLGRLFR